MPHHELKTLPDGKIEVLLETGEKFSGDPLEVTAKLADSKVETRRHYEAKEQELAEKYKTPPVTTPPPVATAPPNQQEADLQNYLLGQMAKGLGYDSADQFKADLTKVKGVTAEVENQVIASNFLATCPDFPNSPESIDKISKKLDEMKWDYTPQSMIAAHALLVRENAADPTKGYKALTQEEINASWTAGMRAENRRQAPPMLPSGNPETQFTGENDPWKQPNADAVKKQYFAALAAQNK